MTAFDTPELHALIQDMQDTMAHMNGAGIAAPQIGVSLRVVIFGVVVTHATQMPSKCLIQCLSIQRLLQWVIRKKTVGEGCLSVPGFRGVVPRYQRLHYTGFDQYGKPIDRLVSGFHARVVQHETDHLDGILYPMRIQDLTKFGFTDVLFPNQDIQDD